MDGIVNVGGSEDYLTQAVTKLNDLYGDINLVEGDNITLEVVDSKIIISSSVGSGGGVTEIPQANEIDLGGIRASERTTNEVSEVKIDLASGKLYAPASDSAINGIPTGGTSGQVLSKIDDTDYNTKWINILNGGGLSLPNFMLADEDGIKVYDNANKENIVAIVGRAKRSGSVIPEMTSSTTPSGLVEASSEFNSSYAGWKVFDKNINTYWATPAQIRDGWVSYDFGAPTNITSYSITSYIGRSDGAPKDWTFEAWNGVSWVVLDTQINVQLWAGYERKTYNITPTEAYQKYRLNITANNGRHTIVIAEIDMLTSGNYEHGLFTTQQNINLDSQSMNLEIEKVQAEQDKHMLDLEAKIAMIEMGL